MFFVLFTMSLIVLVLLYMIKQRQTFKLIEHIPGPSPLPFIGNALELGTNAAEFLKNLQKLTKTYGDVVRLSIGSQIAVLLTNPKYIAQVLTLTDSHYKGDLYKMIRPLVGDGLLSSSGEKWVRHRRILNPAFSNKQLRKYVVTFNSSANKLVDQLKELSDLEYVDITDPVFAFTLFTLCKTIAEVDIKENTEFRRCYNKLSELVLNRYMSPLKMSDFLYRFTKDYRETKKFAKYMDDFVRDLIKRRKQEFITKNEDVGYSTMLDEMFSMSGEDALTDDEILDQVKTFASAGSDTVGITLSFAIYELAKHSSIQAKILEEIECVLGTDLKGDINFEDLHKLKYMECVLKEVMRLYAPGVVVTRILPSKTYFDDLYVPANTLVMVFIYGLHHSEKYFPNPEEFDPDRFLPENCTNQETHTFIPFASGVRNCIGQKYGMLEAKLTLAKIVRNFEIAQHPDHEPVLIASGTLKSGNGLPVILKLRRPCIQKCGNNNDSAKFN